ncbi:tyrosine-type recombinase/integrase [Lacipirellula parvula]|uniref:Tyr recombinase domain-containing protein n=1 Tax=Lacipirellula parvula TaxID=2650471 RepID=A0A5K7XJY4_9BACT|nr:tyrosine-type recombinase/integrase [Lacipirellula parvula]BBO34563.1 hypothetical protein PLANPX_4175 [Lacipirellula parvula]
MASIFRRTGKDGKQADKYSIRYKDSRGRWRTVVGCPDLESTRKLARKLESDATLRQNGVDEVDLSAELPFTDFESDLRASGCVASHIELTVGQIKSTFAACGIKALRDMMRPEAATKINHHLANKKCAAKRKGKVKHKEPEKLTTISARTRNAYVTSIRHFCKWLVDSDRLPYCKLGKNLHKVEQADKPIRRAATDAELGRILTAARKGTTLERLSGEDRYWLYRVAAATGFRARELSSLTPSSFKLRGAIPYIVCDETKNGELAEQPICPALATELGKWLRGKSKNEPIWPGKWYRKAAEMLRADLLAAGVPYRADGRALDFHALRATFITGLARAGVHPRTAQILARHSTVELTMQVYTHLNLAEVASALPKAV